METAASFVGEIVKDGAHVGYIWKHAGCGHCFRLDVNMPMEVQQAYATVGDCPICEDEQRG